jgi:hypothetical protein
MATTDYVDVVDVTDSQMSHGDDDSTITENNHYLDNSSDHSFLDPDDEALHFFHVHHEGNTKSFGYQLTFLDSEYDEDNYEDVGFPLFAPTYLLDAEDDEDEEYEYYSDGFDGYAIPEELERFTQMFDFIHQLMSRRNNILGNYIPDDEFDDSYEALLRLSERIGEVKQRGFNQMQVDSLPTKLYQPDLSSTPTQKEESSCPICLESFHPNCLLMYFECGHQFHSECSKRWLRQRSTCPVCRIEIPPPVIDLREDD